ncbi:unnamed protein product [Lactuca virosa]|uniref:F-box domain-containing protein n=1 Tax=Lactuca virosa TaxID=75947 RepID=A0AAU9P3L4_9ASTR|nr:unnamed protein product [Lactuca virosa]
MEELPVPIMVDILSRLPVKTIIHCKCVCKKWLDLISDSYFANSHISRSYEIVMIHHKSNYEDKRAAGILKWVEVEDKLDHHHLHHDPVMSLDLNLAPIFQWSDILPVGSVNGLVCLWQCGPQHENTYICNPVTREYMILPRPRFYKDNLAISIVYSFGFGSLTQEYKVIRIFHGAIPEDSTPPCRPHLLEAEVYTLGTGRWRSVGPVSYSLIHKIYGPFLNGHAHWTVADHDSPERICAFDFHKETFELFPSPPPESEENFLSLGVINGCLCQSDTDHEYTFTVWMMKEYAIKKSWHKELVIQQSISYDLDLPFLEPLYIIKGLKDGTILMASYSDVLFVYCPRRNVIVDPETFDWYFRGFAYRPSFPRLRNFENERVHVF